MPATSDLLDINFGNLPVEPTPPTPGTPSIEVHFAGPSDQNSEVSNETKSDTDSSAPTDSWSVSTQYPESRADGESVRDDAKSEQSLEDKSQLAEDGSDAFDFPTPKEGVVNDQKDDAPVSNTADAMDFDFPAPGSQPEQQARETVETPNIEEPDESVLLTPVQPSEDKPSDVQDDMISVTSDTVPTSTNSDFAFEDEFKSAPVATEGSVPSNNAADTKSDNSSLEHSTNEEHEKSNAKITQEEKVPEATSPQPSEDFFGSTPLASATETPANESTSSDFDFPAPSEPQPQQPIEQSKTEEPESKPETSGGNNDFTFDTEFTATSENKQAEEPVQEKPAEEPNQPKSSNDSEFESEFTSAPTPTNEGKQPENVQENKPTETPAKSDNDFEFEGEFTSAPSVSATTATSEEKQPENSEESKPIEPSPVKSDNDFEFESEFTSAPTTTVEEKKSETSEESKPVETTPSKSDNDFEFEGEFTSAPSQPTDEKKSDNDFEFEGEFTSAPTPSVPTATNNTANTNDDDDFFDSEFQAAPTAPQVPQEQPQAPKSGGTFEADFDEDFEGFAQAPTTPQPPVQPLQPVAPQTQWLFDGSETEVHDRLQALVSTLFVAPAPSKVLPDINTTVEEKLEELRSSAPVADTTPVALPAPSVFAEHLKELLASVVSTFITVCIRANRIVDRSFH